MSGERTEQPTQRRREEARRRGEGIGRSHELAMALTLGVGVLALPSLLSGAAATLAEMTRAAVGEVGLAEPSRAVALSRLGAGLATSLVLVLPLAGLVAVAGTAANLAAGGFVLSSHHLRFDLSRLDPARGLRRMVDRQALVRLAIAMAKLVLLAFVCWQVLGPRVAQIIALTGARGESIAEAVLDAIFQLGLVLTVALGVVGLADFTVQRRRALQQLRMTRDELRHEVRESEGDPFVRAARRRRARQLAFARMMEAVKTADVVITNPVHLAVALKYDSLTMRAPRLVAKGRRLMAERIREIAREHGVPVVEDVPLARALVERPLGSEIPTHLYRAVARLLVIVQHARFGLRAAAGGSEP